MQLRGEERMREDEYQSTGPKTLLLLAAAVLVLAAAALAFNSVDAAIGSTYTYQNGWSVGSMVLMYTGNAIYLPSVILGLAALGLAQSKATRGHATKMARALLFLCVLVVIVGIGRVICEVGSDYYAHMETLGWQTAQTVFRVLGRSSLLNAGTLAGLAYLCRQRAGST